MAPMDETIEIREGDYVVAMQVPPALPGPRSLVRTTALIAFAFGFLATAVVGVVAALV